MLSSLFKKAMDSKLTGKLAGASYMAPVLAGADLLSNKPFFKGAAQGQRAFLGTGAAIAGGMLAAPMLGGAGATASTPAVAGAPLASGGTIMTASQLPATTAQTGFISQLLQSGMGGQDSQEEQPQKEFQYTPAYKSRYTQI
jgi:hypothetical protein